MTAPSSEDHSMEPKTYLHLFQVDLMVMTGAHSSTAENEHAPAAMLRCIPLTHSSAAENEHTPAAMLKAHPTDSQLNS